MQVIEKHPTASEVSEFALRVQGMGRGQYYVRKGCKLWLSSEELGMVFTILRKSTRLHYNETHFCNEHKAVMDNKHFLVCDKLR